MWSVPLTAEFGLDVEGVGAVEDPMKRQRPAEGNSPNTSHSVPYCVQ